VGEETERLVNLSDALLENMENIDVEIARLASRAIIYLILVGSFLCVKLI
jgi:hypothetical protein